MEAEWAEDDRRMANPKPNRLLHRNPAKLRTRPQEFNPEIPKRGEFFAGLDLAQTRDYSVLSVIEHQDDRLYLRHLKIFQQPTVYATVLGYIKALQDRWGGFEKIRVDFTREGPSFIADMEAAGIETPKA